MVTDILQQALMITSLVFIMMFVTFFASGSLPFSLLLASCVAQDGHGMLPMQAESKRGIAVAKLINVFLGLVVGMMGWVFI